MPPHGAGVGGGGLVVGLVVGGGGLVVGLVVGGGGLVVGLVVGGGVTPPTGGVITTGATGLQVATP